MDTASGIATAIWSDCKFSHLSTYVQPSNAHSSLHVSHNRAAAHFMPLFLPHLHGMSSFTSKNNFKKVFFLNTLMN